MGHRVIVGLKWAKGLSSRPGAIPKSRPRGAKAAGLGYERALGKSLKAEGALVGPWFEFEDSLGKGWCQPDVVLRKPGELVVLEAKYTWVAEGHTQISALYRPVLEKAFRLEVRGIVVCKKLTAGMPSGIRICRDLTEAEHWSRREELVCLHWLGNVPLRPSLHGSAREGLTLEQLGL